MISTKPAKDSSHSLTPPSPNGRFGLFHGATQSNRITQVWGQLGPYLVASFLLILGYFHYAPGTAYSLSAEHYRAWSFPAFRYSDLIWLYLRDGLDLQPIPYADFPLEYPPLTGFLSWALSLSTDLPAYFALAYAILAASALLTVWALQRLAGANVWLFAASPALFFYTGHQWDMAAIGMAALGLLAMQRGRTGWAIMSLVVGTSLKLFPVVFFAAAVVERIRDRRFRSAAGVALAFTAGTVVINLPVALASFEGWSFFFRWNRDRLADSGLWVLWRGMPTADLTRWSLVAALAGGIALTLLAFRTRGPLTIPLGATYLLWWLLVNKTFTTHLMLWAILSIALLSAPWWIWGLVTAIDMVGFQLGNYLNLYNIPDFKHSPLIRKAVENIYDPVQIARSAVLLSSAIWGIHVLSLERLRVRYTGQPSAGRLKSGPRVSAIANARGFLAPKAIANRALFAVSLGGAFAVATVAMTWPYATRLADSTIVGFDPFLQIWLSEWIQHALSTNPLRLYEANIFYPFETTLAYTDANIPGALLAAPLRWLTGDPILANGVLVLATFVLAAASVYVLVFYLTNNRAASFLAGIAYAFLPYRMVHLWHLNWLEGALLPLVVLGLLWLLDRPSRTRGAMFGLLAATMLLISFYFSVQLVLICALVILARAVASRQLPSSDAIQALAIAVAVAAAIAIPLYVPYLSVRNEQQLERTIVDAEQYKALPQSYLRLAPWHIPNPAQDLFGVHSGPNESLTEVGQAQHADGHRHVEIVIEDTLYPGAVALLFAVVAVVASRKRRWLTFALVAIGLLAALLSLGPTLGPRHADGRALPYWWLFDHVPFFRAMRVPARLGGLVDLVIVILAGIGFAWSWERFKASPRFAGVSRQPVVGLLATVIISAFILADLWTGGAPLEPVNRGVEASAAADWLATQPDGPIMVFPAESVFADPAAASVRRHYGELMFWSARHWNPLVNGNSGFIPRAYSDFIERFVGEVPRPDGSLTPRISHVNAETVQLLDQIGVRYLVFHRDGYRQEDWPAVSAELAGLVENGSLTPAGEYGQAAIYVVNPTVPDVEAPTVGIFAPTLATPGAPWSPWVAIESPTGTPRVLSLTRPSQLEIAWYDNNGRLLHQAAQRLPLPVVLDEPRLLCSARDCLTSRPFDDLKSLPPPDSLNAWNPPEEGHYVVRLRLSGDHSLECKVDLDVVADAIEVREQSNENVYRWAECLGSSHNPVNNPGARPFALSPPSVTLVEDTAVVDIAVTPRDDEEVRGWFILAPPGVSEPWNESVYQSQVQQKLLPASDSTAFEWTADVAADVDPGIYGLTVWFHRRGSSGWEHAIGGDIELAPIVVSEDGDLRWAGPIRAHLAQPPQPLIPGNSTSFELEVNGTSNRVTCTATWRLFAGDQFVASGNAGLCVSPEIALPADVSAGVYRLQIDLFAVRDRELSLSDAVSVPVVVTGDGRNSGPS